MPPESLVGYEMSCHLHENPTLLLFYESPVMFFLHRSYRTDGTKTISSPRFLHSNGKGSNPSPRSWPIPFRCLQSAIRVSAIKQQPLFRKKKVIMETKQTGKSVELNCIFVVFAAASATSSPATLGMKEHRHSMRDYQSSHSAMQFYNYREDSSNHKKTYTGMLFKADFLLPDSIASLLFCNWPAQL